MSFGAGVAVGWVTLSIALAFTLGAMIRFADYMKESEPVEEPEPLYVPQEWWA